MNNLERRAAGLIVSFKWMIASYCFLVLFHLVPMYLIVSPRLAFRGWQLSEIAALVGIGIVGVSVYVALRSQKARILEPAIAAAVYCLTMISFLRVQYGAPIYFLQTRFVASMTVVAFVLGFASAGITALLRMRQESNKSA